jgi:hypothetical protein
VKHASCRMQREGCAAAPGFWNSPIKSLSECHSPARISFRSLMIGRSQNTGCPCGMCLRTKDSSVSWSALINTSMPSLLYYIGTFPRRDSSSGMTHSSPNQIRVLSINVRHNLSYASFPTWPMSGTDTDLQSIDCMFSKTRAWPRSCDI